jgi:hypothetical protein
MVCQFAVLVEIDWEEACFEVIHFLVSFSAAFLDVFFLESENMAGLEEVF